MIATLTGRLQEKQPGRAVVDVGGVGYELLISSRTHERLPDLGSEVFLHVHTSVREDAITLFGFTERSEKRFYLLLNTVSGVGPKLALGILSGIAPAELAEAIVARDMTRLVALSGVGKKTAQRLCVELADKVSAFRGVADGETGMGREAVGDDVARDAVSALVNLGYGENHARQAVRQVMKTVDGGATGKVEDIIRQALRVIA